MKQTHRLGLQTVRCYESGIKNNFRRFCINRSRSPVAGSWFQNPAISTKKKSWGGAIYSRIESLARANDQKSETSFCDMKKIERLQQQQKRAAKCHTSIVTPCCAFGVLQLSLHTLRFGHSTCPVSGGVARAETVTFLFVRKISPL